MFQQKKEIIKNTFSHLEMLGLVEARANRALARAERKEREQAGEVFQSLRGPRREKRGKANAKKQEVAVTAAVAAECESESVSAVSRSESTFETQPAALAASCSLKRSYTDVDTTAMVNACIHMQFFSFLTRLSPRLISSDICIFIFNTNVQICNEDISPLALSAMNSRPEKLQFHASKRHR